MLAPLQEVIGGSDCEAIRDGFLAQPTNAITSGAYVVAGVIVWLRVPREARWGFGGGYAALLALVGVGSVLYHGPQVAGSKLFHDAPIPLLLLLIAVVVVLRWRRDQVVLPGLTRTRLVVLAVIGAVAGLAYLFGRTGSPLCDADSPLQLHGLWHLGTATAFVVVADLLFRPAPVAVGR